MPTVATTRRSVSYVLGHAMLAILGFILAVLGIALCSTFWLLPIGLPLAFFGVVFMGAACQSPKTPASVGALAEGVPVGGSKPEVRHPLGSSSAHAEHSVHVHPPLQDGRLARQELEELRGRLLAITRQANTCHRTAMRLLQFPLPVHPMEEKCGPEQVIDKVVKLFGSVAQEKGVHLEKTVNGDLPHAPVGPADLEVLLLNLLQNSLDACVPGDTVRIQAARQNGELQLIVDDSGCGIPSEILHRIFYPFLTTKPVGQGTGLGLSVCLGIVGSVGGAMQVESTPGRGTCVTVTMPVEPSLQPQAQSA